MLPYERNWKYLHAIGLFKYSRNFNNEIQYSISSLEKYTSKSIVIML